MITNVNFKGLRYLIQQSQITYYAIVDVKKTDNICLEKNVFSRAGVSKATATLRGEEERAATHCRKAPLKQQYIKGKHQPTKSEAIWCLASLYKNHGNNLDLIL